MNKKGLRKTVRNQQLKTSPTRNPKNRGENGNHKKGDGRPFYLTRLFRKKAGLKVGQASSSRGRLFQWKGVNKVGVIREGNLWGLFP